MTELESVASERDQRGEGEASCPGEIREEDVEKQAVAAKGNGADVGCTVWNDLRVAAELALGRSDHELQVIYPEARLELAMHSGDNLQVSVRLRDDVNICGVGTAVPGSTLRLSKDFGDFGDHATKHIRKEHAAAKQESLLREQRQKEINQQLNAEVTQTILWRQKMAMVSISLCLLIVLGAMVSSTVAAFSLWTELQCVGLAMALLGLSSCACWGVTGLCVAQGGSLQATLQMRQAVRSAHPDLQGFEDTDGFEGEDDWRGLTFCSCACCVPLVVLGCMAAMSVASGRYGWALAVLWGLVPLMMCCGGVFGWHLADDFADIAHQNADWRQKTATAVLLALIAPLFWPWMLLHKCGLPSRLTALLLKPPKRSLDMAVHTAHDHTIVFEGNVLPGCETVCSWPGKYATAWDLLVAGSRKDDISAAVVFLPEGSQHYGFHDPIPPKQDLQDLRGECWCIPLYGERKPWGCRWWSKWIANIEQAASLGCTLVVYYFNGRRGGGKVKDFTTAGEEHVRREAIERCKDAFLKCEVFGNALEAGLKHLPKEKGPDSSSPYSREVHRLFLANLSEEDRQFLVSSEGLGNSQKAEVAWLERNGYRYIEKEVRELESSSPKAIGRVTE